MMTPRQRDILDFIVRHYETDGVAPTLQVVADNFGISKVTVHGHFAELVAKKYLTVAKGKWRAYKPIGVPCRTCRGTGIQRVKE